MLSADSDTFVVLTMLSEVLRATAAAITTAKVVSEFMSPTLMQLFCMCLLI